MRWPWNQRKSWREDWPPEQARLNGVVYHFRCRLCGKEIDQSSKPAVRWFEDLVYLSGVWPPIPVERHPHPPIHDCKVGCVGETEFLGISKDPQQYHPGPPRDKYEDVPMISAAENEDQIPS